MPPYPESCPYRSLYWSPTGTTNYRGYYSASEPRRKRASTTHPQKWYTASPSMCLVNSSRQPMTSQRNSYAPLSGNWRHADHPRQTAVRITRLRSPDMPIRLRSRGRPPLTSFLPIQRTIRSSGTTRQGLQIKLGRQRRLGVYRPHYASLHIRRRPRLKTGRVGRTGRIIRAPNKLDLWPSPF